MGNKMSWAFKQHPRKLDYVDYKNEKSEFCKTRVLLKAKLLLDLSFAESYSCNERAMFQGVELLCPVYCCWDALSQGYSLYNLI